MKKILFTLIGSFIIMTGIYAQQAIQWQKSLGGTDSEYSNDVQATPDGGCIIVGTAYSFDGDVTGNHGGGDGWIVKLDASGNIEWERTVGGSLLDQLNGVALTADGGYIAVGGTNSDDGDVTGYLGGFSGNNIWVVKIDSLGNIEWNNSYGGTGGDNGFRISQTSDGGYLFSGSTNSTDGDVTGYHPPPNPFGFSNDIWVVKINSTGMLEWQKCLGGSKNEFSADCRETPDGGYIVSGTTWGSFDGDVIGNTDTVTTQGSSPRSVWIVKLDAAQNIVWQETYGGSGRDDANGNMILEDGGYTFLGLTKSLDGDVIGYHGDSTSSGSDFWLVHLDTAGIIQWQACFGADSSFIPNGGGMTKTQSGGYAMAAEILQPDSDFPGYHPDPLSSLSADFAVVECDSARNLLWQHCYGSFSHDSPGSLTVAVDGGLIIAGNSGGNNGDVSGHHGPLDIDDIWVLKLANAPLSVQSPASPVHAFKVYPNPVSTTAKIAFYLRETKNVSVAIYDLSGKVIKSLLNENLNSGYRELNWNCDSADQKPVSNGVYFVKVTSGNYTVHSKITVIR